MIAALPLIIATLCAVALLTALFALYMSLRAAFTGVDDVMSDASLVSASRTALLTEKDALLASLRDLASDHEAGKTSDEDLAHSEQRLRSRAKAVLRALDDELAPYKAEAEALLALPPSIDETKPAAAAEALAPAPSKRDSATTPEIPSLLRDEFNTCLACETRNDDDAAFCKKCGAPLAMEKKA